MALIPAVRPSVSSLRATGAARGAAGAAIVVETLALERSLARYVVRFPQEAERAVVKTAFKIERGAKERSAVDTGRLRASIHTVRPSGAVVRAGRPSDASYTDKTGKSYDGTLEAKPASPASGMIEALVGTNVAYAGVVEANGGRTKPPGMWRSAIAAVRGELERALSKAGDAAQKT